MDTTRQGKDTLLSELEQIARAANLKAAEIGRAGYQSFVKTSLTEHDELYTTADVEAQRVAVERLRSCWPEIPIVAEEDAPDSIESDRFFTVDPVDGTLCFSQGGTDWGCIIGYVENGTPAAGVLASAALDAVVTVDQGGPCRLNGEPVELRFDAPKAILVPFGKWTPPYVAQAAIDLAGRGYKIIHTMSAVGSTIRFLRGEACAYFCGAEKIWDMTAAALAVRQAGGLVCSIFGEELRWDRILVHCLFARSAEVQAEIAEVLRSRSSGACREMPR